ncbi:MAG: hypothetical protein PHS96_05475 [Anaerolineales bacterium]|nr:hypothetical protein [Anaerolineales bacterium]
MIELSVPGRGVVKLEHLVSDVNGTLAVGICTLSPEGLTAEALLAADLVAENFFPALELLEKPPRLVASLRK